MKVDFVFIPKKGEEPDHGLAFEMADVPRIGDYVTIARPGQAGTTGFTVRGVHWMLDHPGAATTPCGAEPVTGTVNSVIIECEFEPGPYSAEEHKPAVSGT